MTKLEKFYTLLQANDPEKVEQLPKEYRAWLEDVVVKTEVDNCLECFCFAWKFDENGKISGIMCTLGGIANENEKGQCMTSL